MKVYILIIVYWIFFGCVYAQTKDDLVKERDKTNKEIAVTNRILNETLEQKESSYQELLLVKNKIRLRNKVIQNLNKEIEEIDEQIRKNEVVIKSLESDLQRVKTEYAELVRKAYKMRNDNNNLMYILAAKNINQAYKRIRYLQQFSRYRKKQILLIERLNETIKNKNVELKDRKNERVEMVNSRLRERNQLMNDVRDKDKLVEVLSKKEGQLREDLERMRKIAEQLNKEIEKLIASAAREGKFMKLTPEQKLISSDFLKNKGRFPWPTKYGVITGDFGEHPHPVLKGIKIRNNGIDISTIEGAEVRALFDGEVSRVFSIKGANFTVILRHGRYFTVYHNLVDVDVKVGDFVKAKDILGRVYTDQGQKSSVLHFEIWNETEKLNPREWLSN